MILQILSLITRWEYFLDRAATDTCAYDTNGDGTRDGNWAIEWQNAHEEGVDWYNITSAHSQPLNANMKAYAAWWMFARLAGWDGQTDPQPVDVTVKLNDIEGNPLVNGFVSNYMDGLYHVIGNTSPDGTITHTFDSTVTDVLIAVDYEGQKMEMTQNIKMNPVFDFVYEPEVQNITVEVNVNDEAGQPVAEALVEYFDGIKWNTIGNTGQDGKASHDFNGNISNAQIRVQYQGYSEELTQNIQDNPVFNFVYVPVNEDITVDVYVKDEAGQPVAGATIFYYDGSNWLQLGRTDLEGKADHEFDGTVTDLQIRAQYQTYLEEKNTKHSK